MEVAGHGPLAQHVEGPLGLAQPAHAVVDPARPQPHLGQPEPVALVADQVVGRHPDVAVDDLGVGPELAEVGDGVLHGGDVADDVDPGRVRPGRGSSSSPGRDGRRGW